MVRAASLVLAAVAALALLWQASEAHYQSCLQRAAVVSPAHLSGLPTISLDGASNDQPVAVGLGPVSASKLKRCSRLPW